MDVDKQDEIDDKQHITLAHVESRHLLRALKTFVTEIRNCGILSIVNDMLETSADVENEAKKWLHPLKIRKKRNQKWKQKMASGIHRRSAKFTQSFVFSLPRCNRIRAAFKKTLSSSLPTCLQTKAASLKYFESTLH
jgi:hypothetical protein